MTRPLDLNGPWSLHFDRDGTEDFGTIRDADGVEIVSSQHCKTCWLPESPDDCLEPPALVRQLRVMTAAPRLLEACKLALAAMESALEADDPQTRTQMEWEAEPLATLRAALAEAVSPTAREGSHPTTGTITGPAGAPSDLSWMAHLDETCVALEAFGYFVALSEDRTTIYACPMLADGSAERDEDNPPHLNWIEVTAPEPAFVDAVNDLFGTSFVWAQFAGR